MTGADLAEGQTFSLATDQELKVNSNGSGVYNSKFDTNAIFKVERKNKRSLICSSTNLQTRGFSLKFKGFYVPLNTVIQPK